MNYYTWLESPLGELLLVSDGEALQGLYLAGQKYFPQISADWQQDGQLGLLQQAVMQLDEYFQHQRQQFDLPLNPLGTAFQQQVWQQLPRISYGQTLTYGEIAAKLGQPLAARAVGAANGRNPISIIVPCHRVIASNGQLTGYAGGIDRKRWLIDHETASANAGRSQLSLFPQE
ncbi:methylated-DNA--[protein]-cysteine S-methyltransferase [filamentous cyanobacterium LEGE 11480]|uniref:Methylated-DNA--protein-cysteine methyltransferase n=1 Tax=Romeriopsis navalis LEGE 11480 TaxID=2777977 RepID=A0A928VQY3_9CYAN|nr:methylated-DNA--[protein]-cysteine S-methyltransferase [Romeriopsis navalis]MBE9032880.1 methylated-DNA--[protein]-cysteine S-methyltransferase [Romeriopsis navalis LEGE 11480]